MWNQLQSLCDARAMHYLIHLLWPTLSKLLLFDASGLSSLLLIFVLHRSVWSVPSDVGIHFPLQFHHPQSSSYLLSMEYTFPQRGAAATAAPHVGLFSHAEGSDRTTSPRSFTEWASWEVAEYLSRLQLGHHVDAFMDADVDGDALAYLDADLLNDLGVASVGQRLKLLRAVFDMKAECARCLSYLPPSCA